ncbi:MAG TPA: FAD-dependent oxidoreductase, partial [Thermodesulfobacteriota bacterium]|nr:FAD-dependent oxidoreductase [Thermodesulfobacteriota bacterium]
IAAALDKALRRYKIQIHTGAQVREITEEGGRLKVKAAVSGKETEFPGEVVLMAVGRKPNVEDIGLDKAGVRFTKKGIEVNSRMETNVPGVYAAGDVTGKWLLAHFAFAQGETAAENALGREVEMDDRVVPRCVYTLPEVASVGITEKEARDAGRDIHVGRFPFAANGKATILGERTGFIKVVADKKYGEILGVNVIGPHATELIGEAVLAMRLEGTAEDVGQAIHPHPTLTEAMKEAALDVEKMALHIPPAKK